MWDFETSEPNYTSTHMHMHMHTDRACLLTLKEPLFQADELLGLDRATVQERLEVLQLRDSHAKTNQTRRYYSDKSNHLFVMIPIVHGYKLELTASGTSTSRPFNVEDMGGERNSSRITSRTQH